jgi:hypothetical protein
MGSRCWAPVRLSGSWLSVDVAAAIERILAAAKAINDRSVLGLSYLRKGERDAITAGFSQLQGVDVATFLKRGYVPVQPPPVDVTAPSIPQNLSVTLDGDTPVLDHDVSTDNVGVTYYEYSRRVDGGAWGVIFTSTTTLNRDETAPLDSLCEYRVRAFDGANNASNYSSTDSVTTPAGSADTTPPAVPSAPEETDHGTTTASIAITPVGDADTKQYLLRRNGAAIATIPHPSGALADIESVLIGSPGTSGSYTELAGTHTMSVGSGQWYGVTDEMRLASSPVRGDGEVSARLVSVTSSYEWAKAGVTIRDGLDPGSAYFAVIGFPSNGVNVEYRATAGGQATQYTLVANSLPRYIKVVRSEDDFSGFYSSDGEDWTQLGATVSISMSDVTENGIAVSSQVEGTLATAVFDNVVLVGASPIIYSDSGLTPDAQYTYDVAAEDFSGNISAYSADLVFRTDAVASASTSSDLFAPMIGGSPRAYDDDAAILYYSKCAEGLYGIWDGWQLSGRSKTLGQVDAAIKALNPGFKSGAYMEPNFGPQNSAGADGEIYTFFNGNNFWLRTTHSAGSIVTSFWSPSFNMFNLYYPTMSGLTGGGLTVFQWLARYWSDYCWAGNAYGIAGSANEATGVDALFCDDVLWRMSTGGSYIDGDYDRNGVSNSGNNSTIAAGWRAGIARVWTEVQALDPTKEIWVNGSQLTQNEAGGYSTEYGNRIDLMWDEGTCGYSYSPETWGGTNFIVNTQGPKARAALKTGGIAVFHHSGLTTGYTDASDSTPYRCTRYSYALSKIAGYQRYAMTVGDSSQYSINQRPWIDELSVNSSAVCNTYPSVDAGMGWLGAATGASFQLSNGVWVRPFANGLVLCNGRGNGSRTFTLGGSTTYRRLTGTQASSVNSGATVTPTTSITMADRDGLFLKTA